MCDALLASCYRSSTQQINQPSGDFPQVVSPTQQRRFSAEGIPVIAGTPDENAPNRTNPVAPLSGDFPQERSDSQVGKKRCMPPLAGVLTCLYVGHQRTLAVLGELQSISYSCTSSVETKPNTKTKEKISRALAALEYQEHLAQETASGVALPDWERRLPPITKRAFAVMALARHPDAKAITFRLGHEVVEAALRAKNGPTDYLARKLQRLGLEQMVFVFERSASTSDENSPYHIHGVAVIPALLLAELINEPKGADGKQQPSKLRAALAPPPSSDSTPPIRGYRQRYDNRAIDIQQARTAGGWYQYTTKEIDFTAHYLSSRPDYASRCAIKAGRALYETVRTWVKMQPSQDCSGKPRASSGGYKVGINKYL